MSERRDHASQSSYPVLGMSTRAGLGLGTILGLTSDHVASTGIVLPIAVGCGTAIGAALDARQKSNSSGQHS